MVSADSLIGEPPAASGLDSMPTRQYRCHIPGTYVTVGMLAGQFAEQVFAGQSQLAEQTEEVR